MNRLTVVAYAIFCMAFSLLSGCGGGGGASDSAPVVPAGRFVDCPVEGLSYVCGSQKGTTAADGLFLFDGSSPVQFSVGDIAIGETPVSSVITPLHFAPDGSTAATPSVMNMVRFFMAISSTDPAVKMTIPPSVTTAAKGKSIDFTNYSSVQQVVREVTGNQSVILATDQQAIDHLSQSIYKAYAGKYHGPFYGVKDDPNRTWEFVLDENGKITGQGSNQESVSGYMENGTILHVQAQFGCIIDGTFNVKTGVFSGYWRYAYQLPNEYSGTFTASK